VSDIERGGRMPTMGVSSSGPPANEGAKRARRSVGEKFSSTSGGVTPPIFPILP
jgi:hypothetical protein